jgi:hypothetical protein
VDSPGGNRAVVPLMYASTDSACSDRQGCNTTGDKTRTNGQLAECTLHIDCDCEFHSLSDYKQGKSRLPGVIVSEV